jgi:hypothetical protein
MEQFMFIFHGGNNPEAGSSPEAMQAGMAKWMAWIGKLSAAGQYVSGEPLLPGGKTVSGADKIVADGPYTEGKEVIGGFFIVQAKDMDEAISLTDEYPDFETGGTVQVRQVMKMDM